MENNTDLELLDSANNKTKVYKIGFWSFVAMIFMTVYSLGNGQQIYYQMGYAGITYIVIGIILFFIPYGYGIRNTSSTIY